MNAIADVTLKGFTPDLTVYLDIAPELGLGRAQARGELDRIELEKIEFFQRVRNKYLALAQASETTDIIDASQEMAKVHTDVTNAVEAFVNINKAN
jgi:dTMP kinase